MKKTLLLFSVVGFCVVGCLALSASKCAQPTEVQKNEDVGFAGLQSFAPDSIVLQKLGAEAASVLFSATKATLYRVNSTVRPSDKDVTIGGVKVEGKVKTLSKKDVYLLQFMLSDSLSYSDSPVIPTTPFAPTLAVEFKGRGGSVSLLFSLTSHEVGVVWEGKRTHVCQYANPRLVARFFGNHLDDEFYQNLKKYTL